MGLLTELIATRLAAALGLPVPEATVLWLPHNFPWQVGTDECDAMVQRSAGWNLGFRHIAARPATAADLPSLGEPFLTRLSTVDAILHNVDRTAQNPNILIADDGTPTAIDHGSTLYLSRALRGANAPSTLPKNHFLHGRIPTIPPLPDVAPLTHDAPEAWLTAAGTTRAALCEALTRAFLAGAGETGG